MRKLIFIFTLVTIVSSCAVFRAHYFMSMSSVEMNGEQQGEILDMTEISADLKARADKNNLSMYAYEDNYIRAGWLVSETELYLILQNLTDATMTIEWNDAIYVSTSGNVSRLMVSGTRYIDRNSNMPSVRIPGGMGLNETLIPVDNVYWGTRGYGYEWIVDELVPSRFKSASDLATALEENIGKHFKIVLPIAFENKVLDYTFEFEVIGGQR